MAPIAIGAGSPDNYRDRKGSLKQWHSHRFFLALQAFQTQNFRLQTSNPST
jgi:hypothetical protein